MMRTILGLFYSLYNLIIWKCLYSSYKVGRDVFLCEGFMLQNSWEGCYLYFYKWSFNCIDDFVDLQMSSDQKRVKRETSIHDGYNL